MFDFAKTPNGVPQLLTRLVSPSVLRKILLPLALIFTVLLASVVAGLRPTPLLLAPIALGLGLVLSTRLQPLTPLLIIIAAIAVPFSIGTGTGTSLNAAILLLMGLSGLWLLGLLVKQTRFPAIEARILAPTLLLVISVIISFFIGQLRWFQFAGAASLPAQIGGLLLFILAVLAFLYSAIQFQTIRAIELTVWGFLAVAAVYLLVRAAPPLRPYLGRFFDHGGFGSLFYLWTAALAFSQLLFNRRLSLPVRVALTGLVLLLFYATLGITPRWRSGWLPAVVSVVVILALRSRYLLLPVFGAALAVAGPLLRTLIADDAYSYNTRLEAWELTAEIIRVSPLFGLGPSNYRHVTPLLGIRGYNVQFNSHNQYIDILAQTGFLGFLAFLWFFWEVTRLAWSLRLRVPEGFSRAYVYGCLGGVAGTLFAGMLGDWVIPFVYNIGFGGFRSSLLAWLFLGGLVALDRILKEDGGERREREDKGNTLALAPNPSLS